MSCQSIDIFHIHAARDNNPPGNCSEALEALLELKQKGKILATGVACHSVIGIEQAATDTRIDIIFPLINRNGLGILDGGVPEMVAAISKAKQNNKGWSLMIKSVCSAGIAARSVRSLQSVLYSK